MGMAINLQQNTGILLNSEGEDDINPFEEIEEDGEQLDIDDC